MKPYFAIVMLLSLLSLNVHAAVHKWVDADGNVHYSDVRPDEDTQTQGVRNVTGKDQEGASPSYTPKNYAEREAEMKKAKQAKDEAAQRKAQQDAEAETKKSNCATARENVRTLEDNQYVTTYNENGERVIMNDATRAQRLEDARKAISTYCN